MLRKTLVFLLLNFGALAIGSIFTRIGVPSEWYAGLDKAPWTPPGWMFGAAWSAIMACFAPYMAGIWPGTSDSKKLPVLYAGQWVLNVSWNPLFFYFHYVAAGLLVILLLTALIGYMLFHYRPVSKWKTLLILPYFLWLLIATSLNGYILLNN